MGGMEEVEVVEELEEVVAEVVVELEGGQEPLHLPPPTRHRDQCPLCQDQSPTMTSPDRVPAFFPVQFPTMTSELSTQPDQGATSNS